MAMLCQGKVRHPTEITVTQSLLLTSAASLSTNPPLPALKSQPVYLEFHWLERTSQHLFIQA
jgi:hypothetical protein